HHPDEMRGASERTGAETKALVSAAFPCWRGVPPRRRLGSVENWNESKSCTRGRPEARAPAESRGTRMAIIETEATLHEAHRDNHTHRDVNGGWLRPAVFGAMDGLVSNLALMA